jgi:hypothetical protein
VGKHDAHRAMVGVCPTVPRQLSLLRPALAHRLPSLFPRRLPAAVFFVSASSQPFPCKPPSCSKSFCVPHTTPLPFAATTALVVAVFQHYPTLRAPLMDEAVGVMLAAGGGGGGARPRLYLAAGEEGGVAIQMAVALVLQCIEVRRRAGHAPCGGW